VPHKPHMCQKRTTVRFLHFLHLSEPSLTQPNLDQPTSSSSYGYPQPGGDEYRGRYYATSAVANSRDDPQLSMNYSSSYPPFSQSATAYLSRSPESSSNSHSRSYSQTSGMPYPQQGRTYSSSPHSNYDYSGSYDMQYPASPPRPFACDQCALSFNRQHDLKRHRETHSGEKPFHCNGGYVFSWCMVFRDRLGLTFLLYQVWQDIYPQRCPEETSGRRISV
jgi:hypothetical protein